MEALRSFGNEVGEMRMEVGIGTESCGCGEKLNFVVYATTRY
jgi:hypothetical protein